MFYCFCHKGNTGIERLDLEVKRAKEEGKFLYYNRELNTFCDIDEKEISVNGLSIIPIAGALQLKELISELEQQGAIIPNSSEDIELVLEWYKYIETKRELVNFTGKELKDNSFQTYLFEKFGSDAEIFLKTKNKDFNGIVDLSELLNGKSPLRKAFEYHQDEEFLISEKVNIDEDEMGKVEYRAFIYKGKIMNVSRFVDKRYHQIPPEVINYINIVLEDLPECFPKTFVLDIVSYNGILDICELNPYEGSGKYLYNTVFEENPDLTHEQMTKVPKERENAELSFYTVEKLEASTTKTIKESFSKDYNDIVLFGQRINGFVHIDGEIGDLSKLLMQPFESSGINNDKDLFLSLTKEKTDE